MEVAVHRGLNAGNDRTSVHGFTGTYGDYILGKVGRVFPDLAADQLDEPDPVPAPSRTASSPSRRARTPGGSPAF